MKTTATTPTAPHIGRMDINEIERKQNEFYHDLRQFADRHPLAVWSLLIYHAFMVLALECLK